MEDHHHAHRIHRHRFRQDHFSPGCTGRTQQGSGSQEVFTTQLLAYTANLPCSLIGLEACAGAHFMGAALREQGHEVRLIPAPFVKPYRKSNKNDFIDGEAIAEAEPNRTCALCRSRPRSSSMCRPCTEFGIDWCSAVPR